MHLLQEHVAAGGVDIGLNFRQKLSGIGRFLL